jgi:choline dehydrogenase-like flavoprotein
MPASPPSDYDAIIIGSGFGGAMTAWELVRGGKRVLLLERGDWVQRGSTNWDEVYGFFQLTPAYSLETAYAVVQEGKPERQGICACVGGPSVFYGGASFRFREPDFGSPPEIVKGSGAEWPFPYSTLEPYYTRAEALLGVAGAAGEDPTEPPRSAPYPQPAPPLAATSRRIAGAAQALGLHPSRIPLAISYSAQAGGACVACTTCDGFACAVGAKRDLATAIIPELLGRGLELRPNTVVTRLVEEGGRIRRVEAVDRESGERLDFSGTRVILSAGALASPHLLLASGLERVNPGGHTVGRYLMRHCNAFVYGVFLPRPNPDRVHHKQLAILDYYFGDTAGDAPAGKLGSLQQVMAPLAGAPLRNLPRTGRLAAAAGRVGGSMVRYPLSLMTGLLAIAEDQPRYENRVEIDPAEHDRFGLPGARVVHRYTRRDHEARAALVRRAQRILREAGARWSFKMDVTTFSHAVGTVRMGSDPLQSALDEECRYRGVENLYVVDGSFMPTSAGVNPSLTIAANALRVGEQLARER